MNIFPMSGFKNMLDTMIIENNLSLRIEKNKTKYKIKEIRS